MKQKMQIQKAPKIFIIPAKHYCWIIKLSGSEKGRLSKSKFNKPNTTYILSTNSK
jgi:hypothetical protein